MKLPSSVTLCEVGLRDGLQIEKRCLETGQKVQLLRQLIAAGFQSIEVGSFTHPKAVPQMADTDEVFRQIGQPQGVELRALVPNLRGVQRAIACGCRKVKLNVSASRQHNLRNMKMTPEESVAGFAPCVEAAQEAGIGISGSISMPFASPWEGITPVEVVDSIIEAYLAVGIREISLSDAAGMATPTQVSALCAHVLEKYPQASWWLHFHNTRGMAMANMLSAMDAGMTRFDTAFGGLGGCPFVPGAAGNLATEDAVHMCDGSGIHTGVDLVKVMETSRQLQQLLEHPLESYVLRAGRSQDLMAAQQES